MKGFSGFASELADHGRRHRLIWAVPAAGIAARRLISASLDRGALAAILGLLATVAVAAAFAELWTSGENSPDSERAGKALLIFFLPYLILPVLGWIATQSVEYFVLTSGHADVEATVRTLMSTELALSKVATLSITIVASFGFARWRRGRGAFESLSAGLRVYAANCLVVVAALAATWAAQELISAGCSQWYAAAAGAGSQTFSLSWLVQDYAIVAVS